MASASLTLFLNPLMAFPSPSPNCGILPAPKMIKTMISISTNSIHPNDPNINHSLSLLVPPKPTRSAALNQSNGGTFLMRGEGHKGYRRTRTESSREIQQSGRLALTECGKTLWAGGVSLVCTSRTSPVCLVHLVDLVCFVYLVDLVHLVSFVQPKIQINQIGQTTVFLFGGLFQHPARSLSDIAFVARRRRCGQMRGRRPEADPRFTFHASSFTVFGSGPRTTQMVVDRSPQ